MFLSFKKLPLLSRTQPQSSSLNGSQPLRSLCSTSGWCRTMSQHGGTEPMTCWNLPLSTVKPWSQSLEIKGWSWDSMSWWRRIGKSQLNSMTSSRCSITPYHLIIDWPCPTDFQGCHLILLAWCPQHCYHDTCHGPPQRTPHQCNTQSKVPRINQGCHYYWEENSQPVLRQNRSLQSLLHCNGYNSFYNFAQIFSLTYYLSATS